MKMKLTLVATLFVFVGCAGVSDETIGLYAVGDSSSSNVVQDIPDFASSQDASAADGSVADVAEESASVVVDIDEMETTIEVDTALPSEDVLAPEVLVSDDIDATHTEIEGVSDDTVVAVDTTSPEEIQPTEAVAEESTSEDVEEVDILDEPDATVVVDTVKPECLVDADCDDGNPCTTDSCQDGKCSYQKSITILTVSVNISSKVNYMYGVNADMKIGSVPAPMVLTLQETAKCEIGVWVFLLDPVNNKKSGCGGPDLEQSEVDLCGKKLPIDFSQHYEGEPNFSSATEVLKVKHPVFCQALFVSPTILQCPGYVQTSPP